MAKALSGDEEDIMERRCLPLPGEEVGGWRAGGRRRLVFGVEGEWGTGQDNGEGDAGSHDVQGHLLLLEGPALPVVVEAPALLRPREGEAAESTCTACGGYVLLEGSRTAAGALA